MVDDEKLRQKTTGSPPAAALNGSSPDTMRYTFAECTLDVPRRALYRGERLVTLEPQIYEILVLLIENRHRVVTKTEIFAAIWKDRAVSNSVLTARLHSLRRAIDTEDGPSHIRTIHRVGYSFDTPVEVQSDQTGA